MPELFNVTVGEVSLVDKAANKRKFLILKNDDGGYNMSEFTISLQDEGLAQFLQKMAENTSVLTAVKGIVDNDKVFTFAKALDDGKVEMLSAVAKEDADLDSKLEAAGISKEARDAVRMAAAALSSVKKSLDEDFIKTFAEMLGLTLQKDAGSAVPQTIKKNDDGTLDLSGIPEAQRPLVEALWKQGEAAIEQNKELKKAFDDSQETIKKERESRETAEFITKAEGFESLSVQADKFGPILRAISKALDKDQYAEVERVLKAADEALKTAGIFQTNGADGKGDGNETATDLLEKEAEKIAKAENISIESAFVKAMDQNPALAAKEREERTQQH